MKRALILTAPILTILTFLTNCQMGGQKKEHYRNERYYRDDGHSEDSSSETREQQRDRKKYKSNKERYSSRKNTTDRDRDHQHLSSASLKLLITSIPQGTTIDIHEYFSLSVKYQINNFSSKFRYRLYLVGRNSRGRDTLFMASKHIKNSSGNTDLLVRIRRNHLRGFGEEGDTMRMFVKLDATPKGTWRGETLAKISLRYRRGLDTPVRAIREKPRYNKTIFANGKRIVLRRNKLLLWHANGKLKHGYLHKPITFTRGGMRVTAGVGKANFTKNGKLKGSWNLLRNTKLKAGGRSLLFLRGTSFSFYQNGSISVGTLAKAYTFSIGNQQYKFQRRARIGFFMDNKVRIAKLARPQNFIIGNKKFRLPSFTLLFFTQNGLVDNIVGARNLSFKAGNKTILCAPGTAIKFTQAGILTGCRLARDTLFKIKSGTIIAKRMSEILFYRDGAPLSVNLKRNTLLTAGNKRILFKAQRFNTRFYKSGAPWIGYPARNFRYPVKGGRAYIRANKQIAFSKSGKLFWATLIKALIIKSKIGQISIMPGRTSHFYKNGQLKMGYLNNDAYVTINGTEYVFQARKYISFHNNGMPSRATLGRSKRMRIRWRGRLRYVRMRRGMTVWFDRYGQSKR